MTCPFINFFVGNATDKFSFLIYFFPLSQLLQIKNKEIVVILHSNNKAYKLYNVVTLACTSIFFVAFIKTF